MVATLPTVATLRDLATYDATFVGFGGMALRVNHRGWAIGVSVEDVVSGAVDPTIWTATEDGRHVDVSGWHEGASPEGEVYYEALATRADGSLAMTSHGWVDRVTRRLTQAG